MAKLTLAQIQAMDPNEPVTLVATEVITPHKKGEVFTVSAAQAVKLMTVDMTQGDFGPKNPEIKVRVFDPDKDEQLLLDNHVLNKVAHAKLEKKLNQND